MASDLGERLEGAQEGDALQAEAGAAGAEVAAGGEGLWRYAIHAATDAEEAATATEAADEERPLVLQARCGQCGIPSSGCPPARGEVQVLG